MLDDNQPPRGTTVGLFGGIMSGTSLDGVDAVLLEVRGSDPTSVDWSVVGFATAPYASDERARIRSAISTGGARDLALVDRDLGLWFARAFGALLDKVGVGAAEVTAVGSHGQTVWHEPPIPGGTGATFQLGGPAYLAEALGCTVVGDFRSRDVAAGGQGAPLVPWADWVMLRRPGRGRALQNIGGMANVTFLPRDGALAGVKGFDTGPGVALVDRAVQLASDGVEAWDIGGRRAARGAVNETLLTELLQDPFFAEKPPKSTGRERFGDARLDEIVRAESPGSQRAWDDLIATLTHLTARSIANSYERFLPTGAIDEVVITGGGALNPTLVGAIRDALAPLRVETGAEALGIDPDAREAAAFALLAWARVHEVPGNVPAVTGARGPRVLGSVHAAGVRRVA
jgi:anhydro-N-acetylmuramic acid kinase